MNLRTPNGDTVLGLFGAAHLGDTLCTSSLPRLLQAKLGMPIYVKDHPMGRAVFANNPHVAGFCERATIRLDHRLRGHGHILQRLQQGLELPIAARPKPELYLSAEEIAWAEQERRSWPADRRVCVISTAALTDRANAERVDWAGIVGVLARDFTVIHPTLTEAPISGAIGYRDLSERRYMLLISRADCFVGPTSGGSHVAAAFDVPCLVIAWKSILARLRFPVSGNQLVAAFLYPQHWFIAAEDVGREKFDERQLRMTLEEMMLRGRAGRLTNIGNDSFAPGGFLPARPRRATMVGRRLAVLPGR